jgi:hypothetical protein
MRALFEALGGGIDPKEFERTFREHMHSIWLEIDRAGLMTVQLRHVHTNLAEALDFSIFALNRVRLTRCAAGSLCTKAS